MKKFLVLIALIVCQSALGEDLIYKSSVDLGIASGSYANIDYTEIDLGLNLYFNPSFDWRNAIFDRVASSEQNYFGLDTSFRGVYSTDPATFGFTIFAGPGARIPSKGSVIPFVEGGLILKISNLGVGVGAKSLLDSWTKAGAPNDNQVFLILGISGAF